MREKIQSLDRIIDWSTFGDLTASTLNYALAIQQIPAPTFDEARRAAHVRDAFAALDLADIMTDQQHNVFGRLPGQHPERPALMITAHTDTVFPHETDLSQRPEGDRIYGPGLGDNSMGVAGMLALAAALRAYPDRPARDIWFVATTGEEGLGNLNGMRAAYDHLAARVGFVINLEGLAFGHVYNAGIAVRRLHITAHTEGGHSWLHFGRPSATHAIVELGAQITAIKPVHSPRTTYNIGLLEGGQGINVIAREAGLWLDLRSESSDALAALERQVRRRVQFATSPDVAFEVTIVGDRPAGQIPRDHPLVEAALAALEAQGVTGTVETGSTDGNVPLAAGCPTVTIGITRGGNAHRQDEFVEVKPVAAGMRQLILLTLTAANDLVT